ncbi:MAG: hypothetical protein GF364_10130 [Candidatus Lokiarchaeota archaeon]|nr:hypothetical protein [Candidatus Lokiarchaeota archaeon]
MKRPQSMSLLTIFLSKDLIPVFIEDIVEIKQFHIKNQQKIEFSDDYEENKKIKPRSKRSIVSEEQLDQIKESVQKIRNYLDDIKNKTGLETENIKEIDLDNKMEFEFSTLDDFFKQIVIEIEERYYHLRRITKRLDESSFILEKIAEIASFLNLIRKYGGDTYSREHYKRLNFELYIAKPQEYASFRSAARKLNSPLVCHGDMIGKDMIGFFVFYEKVNESELSELLLTYNCQRITIPEKYIDKKGFHMDKLKRDHDLNIQKRNKYMERYERVKNELPKVLASIYESYQNALSLFSIINAFEITPSTEVAKIEGFVPTKIASQIVDALEEQFGSNIRVEWKEIPRKDPYEEGTSAKEESEEERSFDIMSEKDNDVKEQDEKAEAPTLINIRRLAKPFKILVDLYGTPNYSELDPSGVLLFTFPLLFGLMFGDVGHGLVLILVGILGFLKFREEKESTARFLLIILYCGIGAIFGGILYGENFGGHLILFGHQIQIFVKPIDDVVSVLKMSILIGVSILILGWILKFINLIINKRVFLAFTEPLIKIIMMIGGTYLIFTYYFDIYAWLSPPVPILLVVIPSIVFVIIRILGKILKIDPILQKKSFGSIIGESTLDWTETMLQIISNVASFVRILALEMAHIGLTIVVREIVEILTVPGAFGDFIITPIILIFGHAFVIILELVLVMIHSLRLHFYEFFSKFFVADGQEFRPISITDRYSSINFKHSEKVDNCFNFYCEENRTARKRNIMSRFI